MNPIELAWSKLKASLHARVARSREALERAIPNVFTIMVSNAQKRFHHTGYR